MMNGWVIFFGIAAILIGAFGLAVWDTHRLNASIRCPAGTGFVARIEMCLPGAVKPTMGGK